MRPPQRCFDEVYHVGEPQAPARRRSTSHEAWGLSVGADRGHWSSIRGGTSGGRLWAVRRKDGRQVCFVDMHGLVDRHWRSIVDKGRQRDWVRPGTVTQWCTSWWDDEWEDTFTSCFDEEWMAVEEAEGVGGEVAEVSTWAPSEALRRRWRRWFDQDMDDVFAPTALAMAVFEDDGRQDGLWWEDEYDPVRYSAPRGGIFQKRLPRMRFTRVAEGS